MSLIAEVINSEKQLERRLNFQCGRQNIMYYEFCQVMIIPKLSSRRHWSCGFVRACICLKA